MTERASKKELIYNCMCARALNRWGGLVEEEEATAERRGEKKKRERDGGHLMRIEKIDYSSNQQFSACSIAISIAMVVC